MITLVYGGSGSGKSAFAEALAMQTKSVDKYYIATMKVYGKEGEKKVQRHRLLRQGKGFSTLEYPCRLETMKETGSLALLECMSNLVANEMFVDDGIVSEEQVIAQVLKGMDTVFRNFSDVIIVSNNVFEDGILYDASTMSYLKALGRINEWLASEADRVYEVVVGIPVLQKGEKECQE